MARPCHRVPKGNKVFSLYTPVRLPFSLSLPSLSVCVCVDARDWTQSPTHAKQELHHWAVAPPHWYSVVYSSHKGFSRTKWRGAWGRMVTWACAFETSLSNTVRLHLKERKVLRISGNGNVYSNTLCRKRNVEMVPGMAGVPLWKNYVANNRITWHCLSNDLRHVLYTCSVLKSLQSWAKCRVPVIPALRSWRQEDAKFEVNVVYILRPWLSKPTTL